jgi:hypothetical protein
MSDSSPSQTPTPARLWKEMGEAQKQEAAEAFWSDPEGIEQQLEAVALLAQRLKARPRYLQGLPVEKRARHLAHYHGMPEILAARLLVSYHLARKRPMMAAFLDAVGIAHEEGLISADLEGPVAPEHVAAGVTVLQASYPAEDVRLYFATLLAQDPETWKALEPHASTLPPSPSV